MMSCVKQIEIAEAEAEARKQKPVPPVDNEPSPFVVAAGAIAAHTGHTEDRVTHWAETKGFSSMELTELSEKLSSASHDSKHREDEVSN